MPISSLIYLNLNDKMVHTIAVAYRTHSHLLCFVQITNIPEGRKLKSQENSKNFPNIPYFIHAGVVADGLLEEHGISQG